MKNIKQTIFFLPSEQFARYENLARLLAESDFGVPARYRNNFGSCLNAVDIAYRLGVSPLVVLQNLRDLEGELRWSYQFVRALIEASGHIAGEITYETEGEPATDNYRMRAVAQRPDGQQLNGEWVTWKMASLQGWTENIAYTSMPQVMFRARATTFFGNEHFSGMLLGIACEVTPQDEPDLGALAGTPGVMAAQLPAADVVANDTPLGTSPFEQALALTPLASVPFAPPPGGPDTGAAAPAAGSAGAPAPAADSVDSKAERRQSRKSATKADRSPAAPAPAPASAAAAQSAGVQTPPTTTGNVDQSDDSLDLLPPDALESADTAPLAKLTGTAEDERFSRAFAAVDGTKRTGSALKASMELVDTFSDVTERSDLYLVLLGVVERHLLSMANATTASSAAEIAFAAQSRGLHQATKVYAESCAELREKRKTMGQAYTNLGDQLAKRKARQSS